MCESTTTTTSVNRARMYMSPNKKYTGTWYTNQYKHQYCTNKRGPLFATPCCNTSRATWSTPSEPSHKKPFFEVLSFSALFGPGCCCQLVCFEFGVLHFRLPRYTRNGQVGEHVLLLWFLALVWLAAVVNLFVLNLLCFISV